MKKNRHKTTNKQKKKINSNYGGEAKYKYYTYITFQHGLQHVQCRSYNISLRKIKSSEYDVTNLKKTSFTKDRLVAVLTTT